MTSTLQHRLFALLQAAAEAGEPCPTNGEICDLLNLGDDRNGSEMVLILERRGLIEVTRSHHARVVTIVSTGTSTAATRAISQPASDGSYSGPIPLHQRVDRHPCPRCGVRSDIGCGHTASRLVTSLPALHAP